MIAVKLAAAGTKVAAAAVIVLLGFAPAPRLGCYQARRGHEFVWICAADD
jgi:hypothetical protein